MASLGGANGELRWFFPLGKAFLAPFWERSSSKSLTYQRKAIHNQFIKKIDYA
jgi:hypothetical protein